MVNGTMTSGVYTGSMAVDVREVMSTAYDPEFASKQMLTILQAWPKHENVQGTIEKRMIDGLEARLLRTTHKNGSFLNHRYMLLIYSFDRFWAIDAIAAENESDYIERVIDSAAVRLPVAAGLQRQQIGKLGASLVVGPKVLEVKRKETPNDSLILSDEMAGTSLGAGALVVVEVTYKDESPQLEPEVGMAAVGGLLNQLSDGAGVKMTGKLRDSFPVNVDGTRGLAPGARCDCRRQNGAGRFRHAQSRQALVDRFRGDGPGARRQPPRPRASLEHHPRRAVRRATLPNAAGASPPS